MGAKSLPDARYRIRHFSLSCKPMSHSMNYGVSISLSLSARCAKKSNYGTKEKNCFRFAYFFQLDNCGRDTVVGKSVVLI